MRIISLKNFKQSENGEIKFHKSPFTISNGTIGFFFIERPGREFHQSSHERGIRV
jgi:hypothetical protein